jgi:hypothetical protein
MLRSEVYGSGVEGLRPLRTPAGPHPAAADEKNMELGATSAEPFDDAQQGQYNTLDLSGADVCRVIL